MGKLFILIIIISFIPFVISAQETGINPVITVLSDTFTYTGKVIDQQGDPLPAVSVSVEGATRGTVTDHEGRFTIMVGNMPDVVFEFRFIGMKTLRLQPKDRPITGDWLITMDSDLLELDEVIVTGYSALPRRETASAVTQLNAAEIFMPSQPSIDRMLTGQIPGMTVIQSSGEAGTTPRIRIRGTSSLTSGKSPLWVLDGIILNDLVEVDHTQLNGDDAVYLVGNAIAGINPQDIETITVLKDASATAIYGVQAANGVIVVSTRQGKEGKMQINYNTAVTFGQRPSYNDFDRMNAAERIRISQEIIEASIPYGRIPVGLGYEGLYMDYQNGGLSYDEFGAAVRHMAARNTDWYDILFRNAVSQRHTLSLSGGGNGTRYYGSLSYDRQNGTARQNSSERYTVMMKTQSRLNERLYFSIQLNGSRNDNKGYHSSVNPNTYAYQTARTIPAYSDDGTWFFYKTRQRALTLS
ncbi:MAG: TonB-dependent receptor plug domain-containing protein [Tannerella sp.]|nr:TonB-dependent receptor plug domain-containing protein [Tannerella sp.]